MSSPSPSPPPAHMSAGPSSSSGPIRQKFRRSKDGCLTCRKRRKRCDLTGPRCQACFRLHLTCTWPPNVSPRHRLSDSSSVATSSSLPVLTSPPLQSPTSIPALDSNQDDALDPLVLLGLTAESALADQVRQPTSQSQSHIDALTNPPPRASIHTTMTIPSQSPEFDLLGNVPFADMLGILDLDEITLQLWAADCMQPLTAAGGPLTANSAPAATQTTTGIASTSTSSLLLPVSPPTAMSSSSHVRAAARTSSSPSNADTALNTTTQSDLLKHFQQTLSRLVSCSGDPQGFDAFTALADRNRALFLSILAWAGRHLSNSGHPRYEAICERLGAQAGTMVLAQLDKTDMEIEYEKTAGRDRSGPRSPEEDEEENETNRERMTLLAAALMVMQFRICRGDVWGFDDLAARTANLASTLFEIVGTGQDPMAAQFFDNLIYHDILSSFAYTRGTMVPYSLVAKHTEQQLDPLHTLTGVNMPVFCKMYRLASLIRQRRDVSAAGDSLTDETLLDVVHSAERLEMELEDERRRIDALVRAKPHLRSHRYLHEAFRTASLIQIRGFVLCEPPCSLKMRLLVRQSLSLLEVMIQQNLPGLCSIHWVLFITALCAVPGTSSEGPDDRERVEKLYDEFQKAIVGFLNVPRSRRLVREIWSRNQEGNVFKDWIEVVTDWDWELFLV